MDRLVALIGGVGDEEREKRRMLKNIARQLTRTRMGFLNAKTMRAQPGLGKFFYAIYRTLGPAQALLRGAETSSALRQIVVEEATPPELRQLREQLTEESLKERFAVLAAGADPGSAAKALHAEVGDELRRLARAFPAERTKEVKLTYYQLERLLDLINYDFYFLLKKFDARLPDQDYVYVPRFEETNGQYLTDDLKDFLEILIYLRPATDWQPALDVLRAYKGSDVVGADSLSRVMAMLGKVLDNDALLQTVQLIDSNPFYKPGVTRPQLHSLVEDELGRLRTKTELVLTKIARAERGQQIEKLAEALFGNAEIKPLAHYSEKTNKGLFAKRKLRGYRHVAALSYLKAFILDYYKRDVRDMVEVLLVKGKWANNQPSRDLSEAYHALVDIPDRINELDRSISDEGRRGLQLKSILVKADRMKQYDIARRAITEIDDLAQAIVVESWQQVVALCKLLKLLIADAGRLTGEMLLNWREVRAAAVNIEDEDAPDAGYGDIKDQMTLVYKRLYTLLKLLQALGAAGSKPAA